MTKYMAENSYIDTSMQKGGIAGFSGCVEHTSVLSQLIHEAKTGKKNLAVVWLDLANAYGSVPHKLIEMAMDHYHIPEHIKKIVQKYFGGIQLRFTVDNKTTAWQKLEKGIVTGCTISPILFIMSMNIIMKAAERETRGPKTDSGIFLPATRGFMDDLTVTTSSHIQERWILSALEETRLRNDTFPTVVKGNTKREEQHGAVRNKNSRRRTKRRAKAVELSRQGAWMKWNLPERKITWAELWRMEPFRISFMLRSVYDALPSPSNLHQWGLIEEPSCKLCGERGTMAHIISGCKVALTQGRYRWRHDKVLKHLAEILDIERRKKRPSNTEAKQIRFVREGDTGHATKSHQHFILDKGSEWNMRADIGKKLVFLECVQTTLRSDIVVWSQSSKMIVAIELTVPWEERCEEAYQRKKEKYTELMTTCRERGWKAWLFPVEVGCRGFPAQSVWRMLQAMGIVGKARKTAVRQLGEAAECSSCWLWHRDDLSWKPSADE
ncbi:unnamed protein product [Mytilus coruscus]|uniref:Reverse transcriptase domain-containing protein n=1 Tax=Mytilus coruscus TaxID=42192 RepID=A0A6J8ABI8_MYTCO|nr:unnamed protein product [Mytilus coruscus]